MQKTSIGWTDYSWNPVTGCHKVSRGCKNCYAETLTTRFGKRWGMESFRDVKMWYERLLDPLKMGNKLSGKKVFVCDMSDLFHEDVTDEFLASVFATIIACPTTTFQILTKRPARAIDFFGRKFPFASALPFMNVWIGVSCEDQQTADDRIPLLLKIPAAVRFLSCEPLLGQIDLKLNNADTNSNYVCHTKTHHTFEFMGNLRAAIRSLNEIHWVIAGGESGNGAQPTQPEWIRSLRDQCSSAGIPFFFKQWGEWLHHSQGADVYGTKGRIAIKLNDPDYRFKRLGKSKSGNFLDGVQHLNFPQ